VGFSNKTEKFTPAKNNGGRESEEEERGQVAGARLAHIQGA
jgi:hypothetical protein